MLTDSYTNFFMELEQNNNKAWFHANKKRYEQDVKHPFVEMIQNVLDELNMDNIDYPAAAKDTLFRINRDIRFSTDKRPYHTVMKASIAEGGKKSVNPGIYIAADARTLKVGGGLFMIKTADLKKLRRYLAENMDEFQALINEPSFHEFYPEILGERYKREDEIAKSAATDSPYLLNKQFYFMAAYPIKDYLNTELTSFIMKHVTAMKPVNAFLGQALKAEPSS